MSGTYYKALRKGRVATHVNDFQWPEPGTWLEVEGDLVACRNGLHIATLRQVLERWLSEELWEVEADLDGAIVLADKTVVRRARLVRQLPWDERTARMFAADCAERVLHLFERDYPDDKRPREAIAAARACANGEIGAAALAAAGAAAWAAAGDAAWAAAWAAAGAAARAAARAAEIDWQVATLAKGRGVQA